MRAFAFVTFTSDFGRSDEFVGVCHAVIAGIAPDVGVIDLSHEHTGRKRVRAAAASLAQAVPYGPRAVHLAVVDPGVGTSRRGVVLVAAAGVPLVGPDNGLLVPAAEALGGVSAAYELADPAYRLEPVSSSFHGRDVFAPAAAHLAVGVAPDRFGPEVAPVDLVRLPTPVVEVSPGSIRSDVLRADRFGTLQLAARRPDLEASGLRGRVRVEGGGVAADAVVASTYGDVAVGDLVVFIDSGDHVAVAVREGNALERFRDPSFLQIVAAD